MSGKGAVKHDDRLDALAQGVKYFTDCMSISAQEAVNQRKREEWNDILRASIEDPQGSANHLVLGMTKEQDNRLDKTVSIAGFLSSLKIRHNPIPPVYRKREKGGLDPSCKGLTRQQRT